MWVSAEWGLFSPLVLSPEPCKEFPFSPLSFPICSVCSVVVAETCVEERLSYEEKEQDGAYKFEYWSGRRKMGAIALAWPLTNWVETRGLKFAGHLS